MGISLLALRQDAQLAQFADLQLLTNWQIGERLVR